MFQSVQTLPILQTLPTTKPAGRAVRNISLLLSHHFASSFLPPTRETLERSECALIQRHEAQEEGISSEAVFSWETSSEAVMGSDGCCSSPCLEPFLPCWGLGPDLGLRRVQPTLAFPSPAFPRTPFFFRSLKGAENGSLPQPGLASTAPPAPDTPVYSLPSLNWLPCARPQCHLLREASLGSPTPGTPITRWMSSRRGGKA